MQSFIFLLAQSGLERDHLTTLEWRIGNLMDTTAIREVAEQTVRETKLDAPWLGAFLNDLDAYVDAQTTPLQWPPYQAYVRHIHALTYGITRHSQSALVNPALLSMPRFNQAHLAWVRPLIERARREAEAQACDPIETARWLHNTHGSTLNGASVSFDAYKTLRAVYLGDWTCMTFNEFLPWYLNNMDVHGTFKADEALMPIN